MQCFLEKWVARSLRLGFAGNVRFFFLRALRSVFPCQSQIASGPAVLLPGFASVSSYSFALSDGVVTQEDITYAKKHPCFTARAKFCLPAPQGGRGRGTKQRTHLQ